MFFVYFFIIISFFFIKMEEEHKQSLVVALKATIENLEQDNLDLLHAYRIACKFGHINDEVRPISSSLTYCLADIGNAKHILDKICGDLTAKDINFSLKLKEIQDELVKQIDNYDRLTDWINEIGGLLGQELVQHEFLELNRIEDVRLTVRKLLYQSQILHQTLENFSNEEAYHMDDNVKLIEMEQMKLLEKFKEVANEAKALRKKVLQLQQSRIELNQRLKAAMVEFVDSKVGFKGLAV